MYMLLVNLRAFSFTSKMYKPRALPGSVHYLRKLSAEIFNGILYFFDVILTSTPPTNQAAVITATTLEKMITGLRRLIRKE